MKLLRQGTFFAEWWGMRLMFKQLNRPRQDSMCFGEHIEGIRKDNQGHVPRARLDVRPFKNLCFYCFFHGLTNDLKHGEQKGAVESAHRGGVAWSLEWQSDDRWARGGLSLLLWARCSETAWWYEPFVHHFAAQISAEIKWVPRLSLSEQGRSSFVNYQEACRRSCPLWDMVPICAYSKWCNDMTGYVRQWPRLWTWLLRSWIIGSHHGGTLSIFPRDIVYSILTQVRWQYKLLP